MAGLNILLLLIIGLSSFRNAVKGWPCTSPIAEVYKRAGTTAQLQFSAEINNIVTVKQFNVQFYNGTLLAYIRYKPDKSSTGDAQVGFGITGDTSGTVDFTIDEVKLKSAGTYLMFSVGQLPRCTTLFLLGVPSKPTITKDKTPSVGESVTFTCSSTSTTTPGNHSISLTFNWRVDNTDNPRTSRYVYSTNKHTVTLTNVIKEDASKKYTCTATEIVSGGYTSSNSDSFSFDVYYGPENLNFSPSAISYEQAEKTSITSVTCTATCNPVCIFKWSKIGGGTISNTGVLNLGQLTSSKAGIYKCIAIRSGSFTQNKNLTVDVIYGPKSISFSPLATTYRRDENSDLPAITCKADCWQCSFRWTGPNSFSRSGLVLNLNNLQKSMAGSYTCSAKNTKSEQLPEKTKGVLIEVRYGPDLVSFTPVNNSYIVDEGTSLSNIKCEADCFPSCTYKWTKDGQTTTASNTDTLTLGTIQKSYDGKYTCRVTNEDTASKFSDKYVTIRVRYGPYQSSTKLFPASEHYTINDGSSINGINCSADCYPDCSYIWIKTKQGLNSTVSRSGILSLGTIYPDDAATYICLATNPAKSVTQTTTKQVTVKVQYGPNAVSINKQSPFYIKEGDTNVVIECSSDCYPDCSYEWTNVTSGSPITTNRKLTIQMADRFMTSHYKCSSKNSARNFTKSSIGTINVIVQYAPDVRVIHSSPNTIEGQNLTLSCCGSGIPSNYNYIDLTQKWNNIKIPIGNRGVTGSRKYSSIHFSSLRLEDSGTYTCTLNNGIKSLDGKLSQIGSTYLLVEGQPKILTEELRFTGTTGGPAKMQISIYSYPSLESIRITRHDGKVLSSNDYNITEQAVKTTFYDTPVALNGSVIYWMIKKLTETDFGNYTLVLQNRIGRTQAQAFSIVQGTKPLPPTNFMLFSITTAPIFQWQKRSNGGQIQSFAIETSIAGTGVWKIQANISENDKQYQLNNSFFRAEIGNLSEGVYIARIVAFNNIGRSDYVYLGTTFNIYTMQEESLKAKDGHGNGAVVAGVSIAVVVISSVVAVAIFYKWRKGKTKDEGRADLPIANSSLQSQYEDLKGIMETEVSETYERLRLGNDECPANISDASEQAKSHHKRDKIYENLKVTE